MGRSLSLRLTKEISRGDLSASTERSLRAAIFGQLPAADRLPAYERYAACITLERARTNFLAQIQSRKGAMIDLLREKQVFSEAEIASLAGFYEREYELFQRGDMVGAQAARNDFVKAFVKMAVEKALPPAEIPPPPPPP